MVKKIPLGPDPQRSLSYQELPIGSTIVDVDPEVAKTGSWRFYRPIFAWGTAPCQEVCPGGVDVRGFISHVRKKKFEEAWLRYIEENPFPAICGRICPHPCESGCNRKNLDSPISIRSLERFVSDVHRPLAPISNPERGRRKIGIVGGGPAGLSCAFFLTRLGYRPILFEKESQLGGKLRRISKYHLSKEVMDREINAIVEQGVDVQGGKWRWKDLEKFEAVFFEKGSGQTNRRGWFVGGETIRGSNSVVEAIGNGKRGAMAIDSFIEGRDFLDEMEGFSIGEKGGLSFERYKAGQKEDSKRVVSYSDLNPSLFVRKPRVQVLYQPMGIKEGRFEDVELTITDDQAIEEALRCLECGVCNLCGRCLLYCPEGAVSRGPRPSKRMEIDYAYCKGCGICRNECPRGIFTIEKEKTDWE
jgi:Pyruvate/2-oxoacid:ferredoxin oxidoreductase delta subunit